MYTHTLSAISNQLISIIPIAQVNRIEAKIKKSPRFIKFAQKQQLYLLYQLFITFLINFCSVRKMKYSLYGP